MALAISKVDMNEIWINISKIPGFDQYSHYKISNFGDVCSTYTWEKLKPSKTNGYYQIVLYGNQKRNNFLVHRLVALAFIDNPNNYKFVDHCNGIRTDNRVENLRWVTKSTNQQNIHVIRSNTGHQGIHKTANNTYRVQYYVNKKRSYKYFKTLDKAVECRAEMVKLYYNRPE